MQALEAFRLHGDLIGRQGSRHDLATPVLVVDPDVLARNIARMAALAAAAGVALRPHAKTHKSVDIARLQVAAGAVGLCCAKLGEAEALAEGGIDGLHITSPVVSPRAIGRLMALNASSARLSVVADDVENVDALATAANPTRPLSVIVDIDPGLHRTGVASAEAAVAAALRIADRTSLRYAGVQFYCGREQHIAAFEARRAAVEKRAAYLTSVIAALTQAGLPPAIVTGGGTGTHRIDMDMGVFTELQAGSYVFMDDQYLDCDLDGAGGAVFERSLVVEARVVSRNAPGMATVDAGLKAFATEGEPPRLLQPRIEGGRYLFMGDEQGAILGPDAQASLALGQLVTLSAPHCDPTVDLYEAYHLVRGDTLVDIWPVSARGRSR